MPATTPAPSPDRSSAASKVVAITGASSGIGRATAELLAAEGHQVFLGARRTPALQELVATLRSAGGAADCAALDVTDAANVTSFMEATVDTYGRLDVVVNNAGVMPLSVLEAGHIEEWNQMIDVNIRGVLHGIAAGLPIMRRLGSGHFINLASIGAYQVSPTAAVYCATKFAVWAISEGLRQEVGPDIRVSTISPGVTESELADHITDPDAKAAMATYRAVSIPASAIARTISFVLAQPPEVDVNEVVVRPSASA